MLGFDLKLEKIMIMYGLYILFHYMLPRLYINFCVPWSLTGLIMSPFLSQSPHCKALSWLFVNSIEMIRKMFLGIGMWVISKKLLDTSIETK
jgi:Na+/H+ antiporter NhaC